ncbi:hypothetical protein C7E18_00115 [Stenotrophomonas maltophilia]|nr:hypothetical protein C7E18_00115 [Stenotrophomonas maltophilia]
MSTVVVEDFRSDRSQLGVLVRNLAPEKFFRAEDPMRLLLMTIEEDGSLIGMVNVERVETLSLVANGLGDRDLAIGLMPNPVCELLDLIDRKNQLALDGCFVFRSQTNCSY